MAAAVQNSECWASDKDVLLRGSAAQYKNTSGFRPHALLGIVELVVQHLYYSFMIQ
jgi:hypothetical protein